jgi:hypothetical protein
MKKFLLLFFVLQLAVGVFSQVKVEIHEHINYSSAQLEKLNKVKSLIETVVNSDSFRIKILNMHVSPDNNPEGLSNQQIYNRLMEANELSYTNKLTVIDLNLRIKPVPFYKPFTSVVGYTNPSIHYIVTYRSKFENCALHELAAHYIHEWTHKLGFDHLEKETWDNAVPYLVQNIVEELAEK